MKGESSIPNDPIGQLKAVGIVPTEDALIDILRPWFRENRDKPRYDLGKKVAIFEFSPYMLKNKEHETLEDFGGTLDYYLVLNANAYRQDPNLKQRLLNLADDMVKIMRQNLPPGLNPPNKDDIAYYVEQAIKNKDTMDVKCLSNIRTIKNPYFQGEKVDGRAFTNEITGKQRSEETYDKVLEAILNFGETKPTYKALHKLTGISERQIKRLMKKHPQMKAAYNDQKKLYKGQAVEEVINWEPDYLLIMWREYEKQCKWEAFGKDFDLFSDDHLTRGLKPNRTESERQSDIAKLMTIKTPSGTIQKCLNGPE